MRDFRSILNIIGILICIEAVAMLIPMFFDLYYGNYDWLQFFYSSLITFFIGIILYFSFRKKNIKLGIRQAFLLTISSWLVISLFGAIPFVYSSSSLSYTDAFFESVSGITTTGATVINNLENLSEGILIWRSLLQWFGGIGIIVLANFNNQNGLKQIGNATYVETAVSGTATVGEAGAEGFGTVLSGSLERSNVDITEELVNLITAQRNFQANAKSIETTAATTQAIVNIRM